MRSLSILRTFGLFSGVLALAGCATAPSIPRTSVTQHPNFSRAMANRHEEQGWKDGSERQLIAQTVGPAPLLAAYWKGSTQHLLTAGAGFEHANRMINDGFSAYFFASGALTYGFLGLLQGNHNPGRSNVGSDRYQYGHFLYAVHLYRRWDQAKAETYSATHMEAIVPTMFAGKILGTTGYQADGRTFVPQKLIWSDDQDYEVRYQHQHEPGLPHLIPRMVWVVDLRSVVPHSAVVDLWEEPRHQHPTVKLLQISKEYPQWTWVLVNAGNGKAILYRNGVETRFSPHHS